MAKHRFLPLIAAAVLGLAFASCRSTTGHHHTATPHHGKRPPSDCSAPGEVLR